MGAINKKYTTEEFIKKAIQVHGNLYDYSNVVYVSAHAKVNILCRTCGNSFSQQACMHLQGQGCPVCGRVKSGEKNKKEEEVFIEQAKKVHNNFYSYQKVEYKGASKKVCITCPNHGDFWQMAYVHLQGHGCPICGKERMADANKYSQEEYINIAKQKHQNKYTYEKTIYTLSDVKICVTCQKHGDFWIKANSHLSGVGCPQCWEEKRGSYLIIKREDVIKAFVTKHNGKYDYSLITDENYVDTKHKVPIICKEHGVFFQTPHSHLAGCGCPHCSTSVISKGEELINKLLKQKNIEFLPQYQFNNDTNISRNKSFFVDFYIPSKNIIIEYNGEQHYESYDFFGGDKRLKRTKERDYALSVYCKKHKIKLLTIPYWDKDKIKDILDKEIK